MTWRTHLAVGANSIWLLGMFNQLNSAIILVPLAMFASLLPDLDASVEGAKIHYLGGGFLGGFKGVFHHRGIMHSLFFCFIIFVILFILNIFALDNLFPLMPYVVTLAYLSHPIIDGLNQGVGYLYPFNKTKFALVPHWLQTPVKGFADNLLFVIAAFGIILFYAVYINSNLVY